LSWLVIKSFRNTSLGNHLVARNLDFVTLLHDVRACFSAITLNVNVLLQSTKQSQTCLFTPVYNCCRCTWILMHLIIIIWLLHNLVEASFDLFRYLLPGDQLKPWELQDLICAVKGCEPLSLHLLTWSCTANENKNLVPHNLVQASFDLFRYLLLGD